MPAPWEPEVPAQPGALHKPYIQRYSQMAKHKSATEVTVVTEERSAIQRWVDQHWGKMFLVAVVIAGVILYRQASSKKEVVAKANLWNGLLEAEGDWEKTKSAIANITDPNVKGWGLAQLAREALGDNNQEEAAQALEQLSAMPDHVLNAPYFASPTSDDKPLAKFASDALNAQLQWETANPNALTNPDPDPDSPVVVIQTDEGDIEITLYQKQAPEHVANFLKLAEEKFYDGILFHRTVNSPGMAIIQSGDPNTLESDTSEWGSGGPGYSQKAEKNGLMHIEGVLSAAMPPSSNESSGSQFFITLGRAHHLDGRHTVFGKVTGGLDVARAILEAPVREVDEENSKPDLPVNPVAIKTIARK